MTKEFTLEQAVQIGDQLGVDWSVIPKEQFQKGMNVELEHGSRDARTDVTKDDPLSTGKIAWAHLLETPKYYILLEEVENEAEQTN